MNKLLSFSAIPCLVLFNVLHIYNIGKKLFKPKAARKYTTSYEVHPEVILYQKIQKTGSTTLDSLMRDFAKFKGNLTFDYEPDGAKRYEEMERRVKKAIESRMIQFIYSSRLPGRLGRWNQNHPFSPDFTTFCLQRKFG